MKAKLLSIFGSLVMLLEAGAIYWKLDFIGFPDGYVTELEAVQTVYYAVHQYLLIVLAVITIYTGFNKRKHAYNIVLLCITVAVIAHFTTSLLDAHYVQVLDNGRGG